MPKLRTCPKCKSIDIAWIEIYEQEFWRQQTEDGIEPVGNMSLQADFRRLEARCMSSRCQHRWTPRGVMFAADLPGYQGEAL